MCREKVNIADGFNKKLLNLESEFIEKHTHLLLYIRCMYI